LSLTRRARFDATGLRRDAGSLRLERFRLPYLLGQGDANPVYQFEQLYTVYDAT
jgi:hypothetical protein